MAKKKQKYYVVWSGKQPGIYTDWNECSQQVTGVVGAKYKSYDTLELAQEALRLGPEMAASLKANVDELGMTSIQPKGSAEPPVLNALAVDAACSGNPGVMEYQGVYVASRSQIFHYKAPIGTNNIGEFLAIVHGLSYLKRHNLDIILYSDSVNAINWVKQKVCKSKLPYTTETAELWDYVRRAEAWLEKNTYTTEIRKWDTEHWGEIPADFGRK
ncbi:MAG: ribonuclease H family protein [Bacteroidales bacterium]|nr:ribonuclease H family protein [Bacteroidales bacterium]